MVTQLYAVGDPVSPPRQSTMLGSYAGLHCPSIWLGHLMGLSGLDQIMPYIKHVAQTWYTGGHQKIRSD
jgi:hypothetical protein